MNRNLWRSAALLPLIAMLSACEPGEADMRQAVQKNLKTPIGTPEIDMFQKIGCKAATEKAGYVCDFKMTLKADTLLGAITAGADNKGSGRFVKGRDGWEMFSQ